MKVGLRSLLSLKLPQCRCALGVSVSLMLLLLFGLQAAPARADIWGFIDMQGMPHFAESRLDERYELFLRDIEPTAALGKVPTAANQPGEEAALTDVNPVTSVVTAPPRLLTYFELSPGYKAVKHLLREASDRHSIDYALLQALILTESGFNTHAVSPKGAVGLMQLIPPTAERYGVRASKGASIAKKLTDPQTNIKAGASYLSDLIRMFPGQTELALAAYNAGEGAVQRAGNKIPNFPETINYVKNVMQLYKHLKPSISTLAAPGRVRVEFIGGSPGRGNRVPSVSAFGGMADARFGQD